MDVVGVVNPLGGATQAFHDDQVIELKEQLVVDEVAGETQRKRKK